jgi:hypothetical protein
VHPLKRHQLIRRAEVHSAVNRSEHTVVPASSRTVMRHSVPCQPVQPRLFEHFACRRYRLGARCREVREDDPVLVGEISAIADIEEIPGQRRLRRVRAGALPRLSAIGRSRESQPTIAGSIRRTVFVRYRTHTEIVESNCGRTHSGNPRSQNEPWTQRSGSSQVQGSLLDNRERSRTPLRRHGEALHL